MPAALVRNLPRSTRTPALPHPSARFFGLKLALMPVTTDYARLRGGEVTGFVSSAAPTTVGIPLHDPAGSTIALLNPASGAITNSFTYEPFGTGTVTGPATTFPFRFKGMEFDSTTNLYHSGDGYYSPKLQRSIAYPGASGGGAG